MTFLSRLFHTHQFTIPVEWRYDHKYITFAHRSGVTVLRCRCGAESARPYKEEA